MKGGRLAKRVAAAAGVLLAFGVAGFVCQRVGERGRYVGAFSTYGAGPEGTRGLYLLAEELGARPLRWAEDLGRLPEGGGMLVALGSCDQIMRRPMGRIERENLQRWVEGGGVLVVAGVTDYLDADAFGVRLRGDPRRCRPSGGLIGMLARAEEAQREARDDEEDSDAEDELDALPDDFSRDPVGTYEAVTEEDALPPPRYGFGVGAPLEEVPAVGMRNPLAIEVEDDRPRQTLLRLDGPDGRPLAVRVDVGEGAVVALASGHVFQNRDLAAERGGVLFARLVRRYAPDGPILFDEYHLGVGERRSLMRYLRQAGAVPLVLQILLLVGLLLWRVGPRFGAPRLDPPAEPGGTASYVEGVGALYAKAKDPDGAGAVIVRRALDRIGAHHQLDAREPAQLAAGLARRHRGRAAEAVRALAEATPERGGLARFVERVDELVAQAMADGR